MKKSYAYLYAALGLAGLAAAASTPASAAYPEAGSFDGAYKYTSGEFTLKDAAYSQYLSGEIIFEIATSFNQSGSQATVNVIDFLMENNGTDYDSSTGILTLNSVTFKPAGAPANLGIAPLEGGWTGMAGLYANKMKWVIGEDGTITIPDFDIVTFSGSDVTAVIAEYRNGTVVPTEKAPEEKPDERIFAGTYPVSGTKYVYSKDEPTQETEFDFDLIINENNQVISIGGYNLTAQQIREGRNKGYAIGNQLILPAASNVGVKWEQVPSGDDSFYMEAWLLGGPGTYGWDQLDDTNKVVFTLYDDGSYYLAPFTLWHRYQFINENKNAETAYELLFKWEGEAPGDLTGIEAADIRGEGEVKYYNLSGMELKNPVPGQMVIKVEGGQASKLMLKSVK